MAELEFKPGFFLTPYNLLFLLHLVESSFAMNDNKTTTKTQKPFFSMLGNTALLLSQVKIIINVVRCLFVRWHIWSYFKARTNSLDRVEHRPGVRDQGYNLDTRSSHDDERSVNMHRYNNNTTLGDAEMYFFFLWSFKWMHKPGLRFLWVWVCL